MVLAPDTVSDTSLRLESPCPCNGRVYSRTAGAAVGSRWASTCRCTGVRGVLAVTHRLPFTKSHAFLIQTGPGTASGGSATGARATAGTTHAGRNRRLRNTTDAAARADGLGRSTARDARRGMPAVNARTAAAETADAFTPRGNTTAARPAGKNRATLPAAAASWSTPAPRCGGWATLFTQASRATIALASTPGASRRRLRTTTPRTPRRSSPARRPATMT